MKSAFRRTTLLLFALAGVGVARAGLLSWPSSVALILGIAVVLCDIGSGVMLGFNPAVR